MWTIFQLNSRQSGKQTAEEATKKKKKKKEEKEEEEEMMVKKKRNFEQTGDGCVGGEAKELNSWIFWQLPSMPKNQNSKERYANSCLVRFDWKYCPKTMPPN